MLNRVLFNVLILCFLFAFAQLESKARESKAVQIIYVHGAQQYTDEKKQNFIEDINKLHKYIFKYGKKSDLVNHFLLDNGSFNFVDTPEYYYWGDQYAQSVERLNSQMNYFSKYYYSFIGYVRRQLAYPLHDLLWLSQYHHKSKVVSGLYKKYSEVVKSGKSVVLLGHSAGSVVVFNFMLYHAPLLDVHEELVQKKFPQEVIDQFKENHFSCAQALIESGVARINESGELIGMIEEIDLKDEKLKVNLTNKFSKEKVSLVVEKTKELCIKPDDIVGLGTFGSPIIVSTSLEDENYEGDQIPNLIDYIVKNSIAWLHVNHFSDFIGMPISADEIMYEVLENNKDVVFTTNRKGFFANNPRKERGANLLGAHGWYFHHPKSFAKLLIKTYEKGIEKYYPEAVKEFKDKD